MQSDLPRKEEFNEPLPLGYRYQAAWNEHVTRVSQRQAVIQMYLGAAGVLYGYWLGNSPHKPHNDPISVFVLVCITLLTLTSSALIWIHNRVMQHLTGFMSECERRDADYMAARGGSGRPFYFHSVLSDGVDSIHYGLRKYHRVVFSSILFLVNLAAIPLTWGEVPGWLSGFVCSLLVLGPAFLFKEIDLDWNLYPVAIGASTEEKEKYRRRLRRRAILAACVFATLLVAAVLTWNRAPALLSGIFCSLLLAGPALCFRQTHPEWALLQLRRKHRRRP